MKILHVMAGLQPSGLETMLLSAADQWQSRAICCEILATAKDVGPLEYQLRAANYAIHHIPFRSRWPFLPSIDFLRRYWQLCKKVDLVHIHTEEATLLFALIARLAGVGQLALTVHNVFHFTGHLRGRKNIERLLIRFLGGRFGFVGDAVAANESVRFHNRGVRITNWVDTNRFRPPTPHERNEARQSLGLAASTTTLLTIGNCNVAKNHGALLEALSLLGQQSELMYLHVGQEQPGRPEHLQSGALGLGDRVRFAGPQADVLPWLWAADIFVMPSKHEGLAIAPLEALAAGCPALLADVDGLAELRHFASKVTFASPDPTLLAEALALLLEKPAEIRREEALFDSTAVRAQFSPQTGIDTLCRELYQL